MKKIGLICCLLCCLAQCVFAQDSNYQRYIDQYKYLAIEQMQKYKIPASITLAQGLLESSAGTSDLARMSNNHFGIKCGGNWKGRSVRHDDDKRSECFRFYDKVQDSYEDHSLFLRGRPWYAPLFKLDIHDYRGWAHGLKKAGYATNPQYAIRLISLIERYELYRYDTIDPQMLLAAESPKNPFAQENQEMVSWVDVQAHNIYTYNDTPYINITSGDDLKRIAQEFRIKPKHLMAFNDLHENYTLEVGERVYLKQKKARAAKQDGYVYTVLPGDSMHSIAQKLGIRLKKLYKLNRDKVSPDSPVTVGTILRIH